MLHHYHQGAFTNTNTNKFILRNKAHIHVCKRTNVKQVVNINIRYIKDKIKTSIRHNKTCKDEDRKKSKKIIQIIMLKKLINK